MVVRWEDISHASADGKLRICNGCDKSFHPNGIVAHWTSTHTGLILLCPNCRYTTGDKRTLNRHVLGAHSEKAEHDPKKDGCSDCSSAWVGERYMSAHMKELCPAPGKNPLKGFEWNNDERRYTRDTEAKFSESALNHHSAAALSTRNPVRRGSSRPLARGHVVGPGKRIPKFVLCHYCDLPIGYGNQAAHERRRHQVPTDLTRVLNSCLLCKMAWWLKGGWAPDTFEEHQVQFCPKRKDCEDWEGELGQLVRKNLTQTIRGESSSSAHQAMIQDEHASSPVQEYYPFEFDSDDEDDHDSSRSETLIDPELNVAPLNPHFHHSLGRRSRGRMLRLTHRQALRYGDLFD